MGAWMGRPAQARCRRLFRLLGVLAAWVLALAPRPGVAGQLTPQELLLELEALIPQVERVLARPFLEVPGLRILTEEQVVQARLDWRLAWDRRMQDRPDLQELERARIRRSLGGMLAWYSPLTGEVGLLKDPLEDLLNGLNTPKALGLLRCTLAHELAHTLQAQHLNRDPRRPPWELESMDFLMEGQAMLVESRLCPDPEVRARILDRADLYQPDLGESLQPYREGWRLAELITEAWGGEGLWAVMAGPLPSTDRLVDTARASLLRRYPNADRLMDIGVAWMGALNPTRYRVLYPAVGAHAALRGLWSVPGQEPPAGIAAVVWNGQAWTEDVLEPGFELTWILVRSPEQGKQWLAGRCQTLLHPAERPKGSTLSLFYARPQSIPLSVLQVQEAPALLEQLKLPVDATCAVEGTFNGWFHREIWVLYRGALLGVTTQAQTSAAPSAASSVRALRQLAQLPWDQEEPSLADNRRLQALAPTTPAPQVPGWTHPYYRALHHAHFQRWGLCTTEAQQATRLADPADAAAPLRRSYSCALQTRELELVEQALGLYPTLGQVPGDLLAQHLRLLLSQGQASEALNLAEQACAAKHYPVDRALCRWRTQALLASPPS